MCKPGDPLSPHVRRVPDLSPILQALPLHKKRAITTPKRHSNGPFLPKQIKLYKLHAAFLHEPWRSETDFAGKSSGSWIITFAVFPTIRPVTLMRPFPIYSGGTAWDLHPTSLLNPDTHRAKGYLRVHYSTISVSFQAAVTLNPTTLGRLNIKIFTKVKICVIMRTKNRIHGSSQVSARIARVKRERSDNLRQDRCCEEELCAIDHWPEG